ncbi:MAG: ATP-dependent exonuclease SbcCD, C subunit-like protein, partial [Chitinivibrionales bacterium]|nr:ATP-dependent exonuclease SbcCD, C subunit-like protein [Chitinivibrionales bacterium]
AHLERQIQRSAASVAEIQAKVRELRTHKERLIRLDGFRNFDELDWQTPAQQIAQLQEELASLEAASNVLAELTARLNTLEETIGETEKKLDAEKAILARELERTDRARELLGQCETVLGAIDTSVLERLCEYLEPICLEVLGEQRLTVESTDARQQEVREWLQRKIDNEDKRIKYLEEKIVRTMQDYRRDYPAETNEVDAAVDAGEDYRAMLQALQADDLPKFEKRFKALLNENTIREIANFQSQLNRERHEIRERIDTINRSLADIEYNPGRYILLEAQASADPEIRDFQQSLRACTEGALTGSDEEQYAERKFLQVKGIIDRFRGREGSADLDRRWTGKVTDVRNWFVFAASERWTEDDSEHEHYTDSGGKSGGQKEKLAYTVLAASLAYQFGLEWGAVRSRSFRFVIIDEAFGRGSDESARFGLELFNRLNLQLLIVTPLQKIHIIEPYVASVGFVHCGDGREAQLRNLTVEEYQAEKQARIA